MIKLDHIHSNRAETDDTWPSCAHLSFLLTPGFDLWVGYRSFAIILKWKCITYYLAKHLLSTRHLSIFILLAEQTWIDISKTHIRLYHSIPSIFYKYSTYREKFYNQNKICFNYIQISISVHNYSIVLGSCLQLWCSGQKRVKPQNILSLCWVMLPAASIKDRGVFAWEHSRANAWSLFLCFYSLGS